MTERDRFKLLFGPYQTPRFRYGQRVFCELRGWVKIVGLTNARIPWPKCRSGKRARAIILYGALADAVRRESAQAVQHWWGVGSDRAWKWRKALDATRVNEGTHRLKHDYALEPAITAARAKAWTKAGNPERRRKIAAAMTGRAMLPHVREALRAANLGRPLTEEHRRKMSATHKRRGSKPPGGPLWKRSEDKLVRALPPQEVARRTGRTLSAVWARRRALGLPDGRTRRMRKRFGR
jgi:hypothetical protein